MTRYPKSRPYTPPHDCYSLKFTYSEKDKNWVCPICGEPYIPPAHPDCIFPPVKLKFFTDHPWNCQPPNLMGSKGHCNGEFVLEPGDKVCLKSIKASVLVMWKPWEDYSNG